ncbi:hypothetical protein M413DRAFT_8284 [Hebeloma cylindrosporum]|uniref:Ribosome maturation protein SDO1/SBDS N-terminal domain-containing protein n=1 Tax=Hebeloma cylindrosporum TaxID=76867 RepID=A0A0C2YZM4_HEBCY|nr:hypothetical protein M413DRAFT_8284 [Hebeloma cylindrosporum h7]
MTKLTKVLYKPDHTQPHEYSIIINPEEYKKWMEGDTTIPLADVVDSFQVFVSEHGTQGILRQPSKQQLDTDFGTHKDTEIVEFMLKNGKEQAGEAISGSTSLNVSRGSSGVPERRNRGLNI